MNLNRFLPLIVLITYTEAYVETWNQTSDGGLTTCNYTFTYYIEEEFNGPEKVISDVFECKDSNRNCTFTTSYSQTVQVQQSPTPIRTFLAKNGTISCSIDPGFQSTIVSRLRYQRLNGTLEAKCLSKCEGCGISIETNPLQVDRPVKGSDGQIISNISCAYQPIEDSLGLNSTCDLKKLPPGKLVKELRDFLQNTIIEKVRDGRDLVKYTKMGEDDVSVILMCWKRETCQVCLDGLRDRVSSECGNAKSAELWGTDCVVQYNFVRSLDDNKESGMREVWLMTTGY